ncbi:MAG: ComF family protein [Bacteroidetes bacterium]|nr:ComF family protein [Bacteroidota bacterium]
MEYLVCNRCINQLPITEFDSVSDNPVIKHLWGKCKVDAATSYLLFAKGSGIQEAIHELKYRGNRNIGILLGEWMGRFLLTKKIYTQADYIIPVPLHRSRLLQRGYNQSTMLAIGLNRSMHIPYDEHILTRDTATTTQTRKHRYERYENMKEVFMLRQDEALHGKTFLLIDDVITTGSTLAACIEVLNNIPDSKVLVATLAYVV